MSVLKIPICFKSGGPRTSAGIGDVGGAPHDAMSTGIEGPAGSAGCCRRSRLRRHRPRLHPRGVHPQLRPVPGGSLVGTFPRPWTVDCADYRQCRLYRHGASAPRAVQRYEHYIIEPAGRWADRRMLEKAAASWWPTSPAAAGRGREPAARYDSGVRGADAVSGVPNQMVAWNMYRNDPKCSRYRPRRLRQRHDIALRDRRRADPPRRATTCWARSSQPRRGVLDFEQMLIFTDLVTGGFETTADDVVRWALCC